MNNRARIQRAIGLTAACVMLVLLPIGAASADRGGDRGDDNDSRIQRGFEIAPVNLNLKGKNLALVGLGSYIVNAVGECNGCHSAGPATQYSPGGNPYFGQPTVVNPATYLGGGRDFGAFPDPTNPNLPHIVSRNLTPDKTGRPEGGMTFEEFRTIIRTGIDIDAVHPTCAVVAGHPVLNGRCLPPPFDGSLLQIMPWPAYQDWTDHDLRAIYEYLSAVPCVEGGPGEPPKRCS